MIEDEDQTRTEVQSQDFGDAVAGPDHSADAEGSQAQGTESQSAADAGDDVGGAVHGGVDDGAADDGTAGAADDGAVDEEELLIDGKPVPNAEPAAPWVKRLREKVRKQAQDLAALRAGNGSAPAQAVQQQALGPKPKPADFDFDDERFDAALSKWYEQKQKADSAEAETRQRAAAEQKAWQARIDGFRKSVSELRFADAEDAVSAAEVDLNPMQQSVVIQYAENPALVMLALGRTGKASELAKTVDPIKFALQLRDFERAMKTTTRKPGTKPETRIANAGGSTAAGVRSADKHRDTLVSDAAKTGDLSKLRAYDRQREAGKSKA